MILACACSSQSSASSTPTPSPSPTAAASPSPTPSPGAETPVEQQVLAPAQDLPVAQLCTTAIAVTADGNATPLLCKTGAVNVQAWKYYATISASILGLGLNPTQGQAESAVCDDINHNHATRPEEASGFTLASTYYGWSFKVDVTRVNCQ